jgi:uncharacterized protein YbcI
VSSASQEPLSEALDGSPSQDPGAVSPTELSVVALISREMVRIYKDQFGRGPTKVKTNWAGQDTVVVTLEDTLTHAERSLLKLGYHDKLRDVRTTFQYASVEQFCEPVERLTKRKVRSFVSGLDTMTDGLSIELFVLHPAGYDGPSRSEVTEPI